MTRIGGPVLAVMVMGLAGGLATAPAAAQTRAGIVQDLDGDAVAVGSTGRSRDLDEDDTVFMGDTVRTDDSGSIVLRFEDETRFSLGADAELTIDTFIYNPETRTGEVAASLVKGVFRFVSGSIAAKRPAAMTVTTPSATIGIRGTHVGGEIVGMRSEIALLEPEDGRASAIEVSNRAGSVVIDEPNFFTEVAGPDVAPTPPRRMAQNRINQFMNTLRTLQRRLNRPRIRP